MIEKITGIVIDIVRHNDRHNVVTLFTRERGRVSFLSPAARGKRSAVRNSRIAPLAILEADVNYRSNRELQLLSTITLHRVWHTLYFEPVKSALVMFICEFLNRLLRYCAPDPKAFDYVERFLVSLDDEDGKISNLHIAFLIGMLPYAGIFPLLELPGASRFSKDQDLYSEDNISGDGFSRSKEDEIWFDMRAGEFSLHKPQHADILTPAEAQHVGKFCRMTVRNASKFRLNGELRHRILNIILHYYAIHLPGTSPLKSLPVLREIFS